MKTVVALVCVGLMLVSGCAHQNADGNLKAQDPVNVNSQAEIQDEFGLKSFADGAQDTAPAIQAALESAAAQGGGTVRLPVGRFRLDGPITVPPDVALEGAWTGPHHARLKSGTVLLAHAGRGDEDGPPLISLGPSSALRGVTIYYPEQTCTTDAPPAPYPWTIRGRGMHVTVEYVTLVNPWRALDFGTEWNELHLIRNVFGCPLRMGVWVNRCTDIGRLENIHWNPHYWFRDESDGAPRPAFDPLFAWLRQNGEGFVFGRTDWEYVLNTFCFGYRYGYRFVRTPDGVCNGNFLGIGADGGAVAMQVDAAAPYGLLITNGEFVSLPGPGAEPVQIVVGPNAKDAVVQFNNCAFWGPVAQCAHLESGVTSFVQCNFHYWDAGDQGRAAIEALGGTLTVQSSLFHRNKPAVRLGPTLRRAIITGNTFNHAEPVINESQGKIVIESNINR